MSGTTKINSGLSWLGLAMGVVFVVVMLFAFRGCFSSSPVEATKRTTTPAQPQYWSTAIVHARTFVRERLISPASARFITENYRVEPGEHTFRVWGQVDAANRYGVAIRHNYVVILQFTGGSDLEIRNWQLVEISLTEATR